ncbi:MAG: hypothetical protein QM703_13085 [Gemmatales bacterium]
MPRKTWMIGLGVSLAVLVVSLVIFFVMKPGGSVQPTEQASSKEGPLKNPFPPLPSKDDLPVPPKLGGKEEGGSMNVTALAAVIISGVAALATAIGTMTSTMLALWKDQREREVHGLEVTKRQNELEGK